MGDLTKILLGLILMLALAFYFVAFVEGNAWPNCDSNGTGYSKMFCPAKTSK